MSCKFFLNFSLSRMISCPMHTNSSMRMCQNTAWRKSSRMRKWKAGVRSLRRVCHLWPRLVSRPSPNQSSRNRYSSPCTHTRPFYDWETCFVESENLVCLQLSGPTFHPIPLGRIWNFLGLQDPVPIGLSPVE